jgi:retron-type reverse transcriptase
LFKNLCYSPLGIPIMADRAWEALIKIALEPAAEAKSFLTLPDYVDGGRPFKIN